MAETQLNISELVFQPKPTNPRFKDIEGQTFNRLTVLGFAGSNKFQHKLWYCQCSCGNITQAISTGIIGGRTRSCGCLVAEKAKYIRTEDHRAKQSQHLRNGSYVPCNICGVQVYATPYRLKYRKVHYCSKECSQKSILQPFAISAGRLKKSLSETMSLKMLEFRKERKPRKPRVPQPKLIWRCECGQLIGKYSRYCRRCAKKRQSPEVKQKHRQAVSDALKGKMPKNLSQPGKFANVQRGYFEINGEKRFFRSKWEANYCIYLNFLIKQKQIKSYSYEEDVFVFEAIQFGTRSYRPDFKVINNDDTIEYHEIKGWMTPKSKTQLSRMAKYFPDVKLVLIDTKGYGELKRKVGEMLRFF